MSQDVDVHELRWLLKWALEQLESCESRDTGRALEQAFLVDELGHVSADRFRRAVELSGYRPLSEREANPCRHDDCVVNCSADAEGHLFECWSCGMRETGSPRVWAEVW